MRSTVVVVSYKPNEWLERCLHSVIGQADEVLVVDNGSSDGAPARAARKVGARSLRLGENKGFAGGVAAGFAAARGDLVAVLNDDAVASENWLAAAQDVLVDPTVSAVVPRVVLDGLYAEIVFDDEQWFAPGDPRPLGRQISSVLLGGEGGEQVLDRLIGPGISYMEQDGDRRWRWTAGRRPIYLKLPSEWAPGEGAPGERVPGERAPELLVNGEPVQPRRTVRLLNSAGSFLRADGYAGDCGDSQVDEGFEERRECFAGSGAALVTTRTALGQVGAIDRRFFAYYEDTDWCWRARLAGLRVIYDPAAVVTHVRGQTSGGTAAKRVQHLAERNRLLCLVRNAPLRLAIQEVTKKRHGGGDDGVAEVLGRWTAYGLATRLLNRRRWKVSPSEVYRRWSGVDVPDLPDLPRGVA